MSNLNDGLGARILGQCGHRSDIAKTAGKRIGSIQSRKKAKYFALSETIASGRLDKAQHAFGETLFSNLKTIG